MDRNIAAFLDTAAYTIRVVFTQKTGTKTYVYVCNIPNVKPGDWVVVDAPDFTENVLIAPAYKAVTPQELIQFMNAPIMFKGMPKLVLVVGVDADVALEPDSDKEYGWVVANVDMTAYHKTVERNSQISGLVADAYKLAMRKSFAERILGDMSTGSKDKLLALLHKTTGYVA